MTALHHTSLLLISALLSVSCTRAHVSSAIDAPQRFQEGPAQVQVTKEVKAPEPWWKRLESSALDQLQGDMFRGNLQLLQAGERVAQLRALATQAGSQRWPSLNLDLGWSRTKQLNPFARLASEGSSGGATMGGTPGGGLPESFTQDNFRASLAVSYEVDAWGRISSLTEAAERDAIAIEEDLRAIAITLSATLADLWLQAIEVERRLTIITAQLQDDETQLEVVIGRFQQGLSPHVEVLQQIQQRDRTHAQLPPLRAQSATLKRRIAALLGVTELKRADIPTLIPEGFPTLPALPTLQVPADVLKQRPDVRAAQARLAAADARVSAAVSARLPGLRLSSSVGYQSFEIGELFDDIIWSVSAGLLTPLFQGGRLRAEQRRAEAVLKERLYALRECVITAYHEVEDALSAERSAREQLERNRAQLTSARELFESAQSRYLEGVGDFLTTLTARQGLYLAQLSTLATERALLSARVQLHRALAGDWVYTVIRERQSEETPEISLKAISQTP